MKILLLPLTLFSYYVKVWNLMYRYNSTIRMILFLITLNFFIKISLIKRPKYTLNKFVGNIPDYNNKI